MNMKIAENAGPIFGPFGSFSLSVKHWDLSPPIWYEIVRCERLRWSDACGSNHWGYCGTSLGIKGTDLDVMKGWVADWLRELWENYQLERPKPVQKLFNTSWENFCKELPPLPNTSNHSDVHDFPHILMLLLSCPINPQPLLFAKSTEELMQVIHLCLLR